MNSETHDAAMTRWLDQLDVMGRAAPLNDLQKHLARAPAPEHPDVVLLQQYLALRELAHQPLLDALQCNHR